MAASGETAPEDEDEHIFSDELEESATQDNQKQ